MPGVKRDFCSISVEVSEEVFLGADPEGIKWQAPNLVL